MGKSHQEDEEPVAHDASAFFESLSTAHGKTSGGMADLYVQQKVVSPDKDTSGLGLFRGLGVVKPAY